MAGAAARIEPTRNLRFVSSIGVYIDCSDEAQQRRRDLLDRLEGLLSSSAGISSVTDRGRSVTYRSDTAALLARINALRAELMFCDYGVLPRRREFYRPFQLKGL